jgi:hypothetical protein
MLSAPARKLNKFSAPRFSHQFETRRDVLFELFEPMSKLSSPTPDAAHDAQVHVIPAADPCVATSIPNRSARILFGLLALTTTMSSKTLRSDPHEIERAVHALYREGDTVEIRITKTTNQGVISGYTNNGSTLIEMLSGINGDFPAIYALLNPCDPKLLARAANRLKPRAKVTTSDPDILERRWLLVDCDAVRPAEISSTDAEHEAAIERARDIRATLAEEGWPTPILADSGNGAHLLYALAMPNDAVSKELLENVLKVLAARFNDGVVIVDQTVFNAARISKCYGTPVRKGDDTPDRPHRLSRILDLPAQLEPVTRETLEGLVADWGPKEQPRPARDQRYEQFDVENFIHWHLKARPPVPHEGGLKWVLEECPFNPDHKAPDAAIFQRADGSLAFKCFHNSCADKGWRDVRALYDPPKPRAEYSSRQPRDEDVPPEYRTQSRAREAHSPEPEPGDDTEEEPASSIVPWPDPIAEEGFHGIAGELVKCIEPHSEADPAALLVQFLVGWGSLVGRGPYYLAEADHHHTNEYCVIVGVTSKARKGTSWGRILVPLAQTDAHWAADCQVFGLGSGEALIDAVKGDDKRALVHEGEFARLLAVSSRESSTITANLRWGWDTGVLSIRTRKQQVQVFGAHLSLIGHITRDELLSRLSSTDMANGFANRKLWTCARRSKKLPRGGGSVDFGDLLERLQKATDLARRMGDTEVGFDHEAGQFWDRIYGELSEGRPGMLGAITSRAEAHVIRLALMYALLDRPDRDRGEVAIRLPHLMAAQAVWNYCAASARFIWGDALGDPTADGILAALSEAGNAGRTRWDIHNYFSKNLKPGDLDRAIRLLAERGLIRSASEKTDGRPITRYWKV